MRWCVMGGRMRVCRSRQDLTFQYPCSPLDKGGEGREWGDPACKNPLPRAPNECGWCTLVRERAGSGGILPAKTHSLACQMSVAGVPLSAPSPSPTARERGTRARPPALKCLLQQRAEAALPHSINPFTLANPAGASSAAAPETRGRPPRSWAESAQVAAKTHTALCRAVRR
jgi:hypothetical protein